MTLSGMASANQSQFDAGRNAAAVFTNVNFALYSTQVDSTGFVPKMERKLSCGAHGGPKADRPVEGITALRATSDLLPALGIRPLFGRCFTAEEEHTGSDSVALLSHRFWQRHFGGDTNLLGRTLRIEGTTVAIIGVMPAEAEFPMLLGSAELWRPFVMNSEERTDRRNHFLHVIGRLESGVPLAQARAAMSVLAARLEASKAKYPAHEQRALFFRRLENRLSALRGVESVSLSSELPIFSFVHLAPMLVQDRPWPPQNAPQVFCPVCSPDYFRTLGVAVRRGREFTTADSFNQPAVAIINETMARELWPDENSIGKQISINVDHPEWMEIVGVVSDVRFPANPFSPETHFQVYRPLNQDPVSAFVHVAVRTDAAPESLVSASREAVAEIDPDVAVYSMHTPRRSPAG